MDQTDYSASIADSFDQNEFFDLELAYDAGVSFLNTQNLSQPFAFISSWKALDDERTRLLKRNQLIQDLFESGINMAYLKGHFKSEPNCLPQFETGFWITPRESETASLRETLLKLLKKYEQYLCIYSDGKMWGEMNSDEILQSEASSETFTATDLKLAWSKISNKKLLVIEAASCEAGCFSQWSWSLRGMLQGVRPRGFSALNERLHREFQKAPIGTKIELDGKVYTCVRHRFWSDGEVEFLPKGENYRKLARAMRMARRTY